MGHNYGLSKHYEWKQCPHENSTLVDIPSVKNNKQERHLGLQKKVDAFASKSLSNI